LTRAPEKFVIEAWPDARVQTFEDGLFSYLPRHAAPAEPAGWCRDLRDWLDAKRPVRRFRRHKAWLAYARHPHGGVRVRQFQEAIDAGVVTAAEVDDAVERGWARPSPPVQLRTKPSLWPMFGRRAAPLLDRGFKPHRALRQRLGRLGPH
jgi:hypothetical protein